MCKRFHRGTNWRPALVAGQRPLGKPDVYTSLAASGDSGNKCFASTHVILHFLTITPRRRLVAAAEMTPAAGREGMAGFIENCRRPLARKTANRRAGLMPSNIREIAYIPGLLLRRGFEARTYRHVEPTRAA
jgi:hypothetical protein